MTTDFSYRALFLSYGRSDLLRKSLEAFFKASRRASKVVVIDNASPAEDRAELVSLEKEYPEVEFAFLEENLGGRAFDRWLETLEEDWVFLIENDMELLPGWEDAFARVLAAWPEIGQLSPLGPVPTDDEVWDPHKFDVQIRDGVVIHPRKTGNVGTTCLLRADLVRAGLRVHNLSEEGSVRLPYDLRLSKEVREAGAMVASMDRYWVRNIGHCEEEFRKRETYYRENYRSKPVGEDGWLERRRRFANRQERPDRQVRIASEVFEGMPCWAPGMARDEMSSRRWTMLDGGSPEWEGLEWLSAWIRVEKPDVVAVVPAWTGAVARVAVEACRRNGFGRVLVSKGRPMDGAEMVSESEMEKALNAENSGLLVGSWRGMNEAERNSFSKLASLGSLMAIILFGDSQRHFDDNLSTEFGMVRREWRLPLGLVEWRRKEEFPSQAREVSRQLTESESLPSAEYPLEPFQLVVGPGPDHRLRFGLPLRETDFIQRKIAGTSMPYEVEVLEALSGELSASDIVVDVGANIGNHALTLARRCGVSVVAFEPGEEARRQLRENIALNQLESQVEVRSKAMGARCGRGQLEMVSKGNLGGNRVVEIDDQEGIGFEIGTLDSEDLAGRVALLKIDVEGMERDVLEGAIHLLKNDRPLLCIEIFAEAYGPISTWLRWQGYRIQRVFLEHHTFWFRHECDPAFQARLEQNCFEILEFYGAYGLLRKRMDHSISAIEGLRKSSISARKQIAPKQLGTKVVHRKPGESAVSQELPFRAIFSVNTGRCGSDYLAQLVATCPNAVVEHEPRPIGHDEALHLYQKGDLRMMEAVVKDRLKRIRQANEIGKIYVETNHCFIKGFGWLLAEKLRSSRWAVIELQREPGKIAESLFRNRTSPFQMLGRRWLLCPDQPGMLVRPPGLLGSARLARRVYEPLRRKLDKGQEISTLWRKRLESYEMRALRWYVDEILARGLEFQRRFPEVHYEQVDLFSLNKIEFVRKLWNRVGLEEGPDLERLIGQATNRKR